MKKVMVLPLFLLMFLSLSCQESKMLDININFEALSEHEPAGIVNWPHALFAFDNNRCTGISLASNREEAKEIQLTDGNRITVLAYENKQNITFSHKEPGLNSVEYFLSINDVNGEIPRVWIDQAPTGEGNTFSVKPLTSAVVISLKNVPDSLKSVRATIPGMTDVLYIASRKTEAMERVKDKVIEIAAKESGNEIAIFPMVNSSNPWNLQYTLQFENSEIEGSMVVEKEMGSGQKLEIEINLGDFAGRSYDVT